MALYFYLFIISFKKKRIQEYQFQLLLLRESMRFLDKALMFPFMRKIQ
jgi:hypothetical protein